MLDRLCFENRLRPTVGRRIPNVGVQAEVSGRFSPTLNPEPETRLRGVRLRLYGAWGLRLKYEIQ